jgi:uracil-DNA glycosylase
MPDSYSQLLDATIQYVQGLKDQGIKWVTLSPSRLNDLAKPMPSPRKLPAPPPPVAAAPTEDCQRDADRSGVSRAVLPKADSQNSEPKTAAFANLQETTLLCQKCPHLVRSRKNVVFGVGSIFSPLMFVGEAPGADEDAQGEPFVGAAGQLLTKMIKAMAFSRETVYIANILKCRPDTPGQSSGNRKPTPEEMQTCLPYLLQQIRLIQPQVLVALGATAMEGLFGKTIAISKARGHWHQFDGIPVMPTYHPSYLLRNQSLSRKREVWEDMLAVLERLGAPISDKQRAYFVKA